MKKAKILDYQKEQYRGTIKQIMKVRGLRTISLANYNLWKGNTLDIKHGVHSLRLDLQDGYVNIFGYRTGTRKPMANTEAMQDASAEVYRSAYEQVMTLLSEEASIPSKVRRNILVRLAR